MDSSITLWIIVSHKLFPAAGASLSLFTVLAFMARMNGVQTKGLNSLLLCELITTQILYVRRTALPSWQFLSPAWTTQTPQTFLTIKRFELGCIRLIRAQTSLSGSRDWVLLTAHL